MAKCHTLLVLFVVSFISSSNVFTEATRFNLRRGNNSASAPDEIEERGFQSFKSVFAKASNKFKATKAQVKHWAKQDKPREYFLKVLGHHKLTIKTLKAKFKHFVAFMKTKVQRWFNSGKEMDDVNKPQGMEHLPHSSLTNSINSNDFDTLMTKKVWEWVRSERSIDDVKTLLGMDTLSAEALKTSANYKYFDEFMENQAKYWTASGVSIDGVKKALGLENLSAEAFKASANYKYYDTFMSGKLSGWLYSRKTTDEVKTLLGLDKLTASTIKLNPNVKYYDMFLDKRVEQLATKAQPVKRAVTYDEYMRGQVCSWLSAGKTVDYVRKEMGLNKLSADAIKTHINYQFFDEFMTMQTRRWLDEGKTIDEVKQALKLSELLDGKIKANANYKYLEMFMTWQTIDKG